MHFRKGKIRHRGPVHLNLIPLTDCALILLIFYALSVNFGVSSGIKVNLPKAGSEALKKEKKEMTVGISREGVFSLEGKIVSIEGLATEFKRFHSINPEAMVIIEGDADALHGKVVQVMDVAKGAGLNKLAIATKPKEK